MPGREGCRAPGSSRRVRSPWVVTGHHSKRSSYGPAAASCSRSTIGRITTQHAGRERRAGKVSRRGQDPRRPCHEHNQHRVSRPRVPVGTVLPAGSCPGQPARKATIGVRRRASRALEGSCGQWARRSDNLRRRHQGQRRSCGNRTLREIGPLAQGRHRRFYGQNRADPTSRGAAYEKVWQRPRPARERTATPFQKGFAARVLIKVGATRKIWRKRRSTSPCRRGRGRGGPAGLGRRGTRPGVADFGMGSDLRLTG
jgi:hypothetical protein